MWKRSSLKSFELNNQLQAKIYPNPASKDVWIEIGSLNNEKLTIIFNDMTGKQVLIQINILQEGANKLNVNIKGLKKGIYTLELKTTTKTSVLNLQID